jgi:hypothetical protein
MKYPSLLLAAGLCFVAKVPAGLLHDNGPLVTNPGAGFGGADASTPGPGLNTLGYGMQTTLFNRVADNFVVPEGERWRLTSARFFGYQGGSSLVSTFTELHLRIWSAAPYDPAATVVWGDLADNFLATSGFSGIYRTPNNNLEASNRPIMLLDAHLDVVLPAGEYWLEWCAAGSMTSGPFAPPVSIPDQPATGDGLHFTGGEWLPLESPMPDGHPQGLPFRLEGDITVIPEPATGSLMALMLLTLTAHGQRRARR